MNYFFSLAKKNKSHKMGTIIIRTIKIAQIKIPSVEPTSKSISIAAGVGAGVGRLFCDIVVLGSNAALKKASATPMMTNKTVRDCEDSFFIIENRPKYNTGIKKSRTRVFVSLTFVAERAGFEPANP